MSFGCGIGDIATITKFALDMYRACKTSAKEFQRLANDVSNLRVILEDLSDDLKKDGVKLSKRREERLCILLTNAYNTLHDLQQELLRYDSLSTIRQKKYDAVRFGFKEVSDIRLRIVSSISALNAIEAILTRLENTQLRRHLIKYFKEVKAAREGEEYAGSILAHSTSETIRSIESWQDIRSELEEAGIDDTVLHEKQDYITEVLQEAIEEGVLDNADVTDVYTSGLFPRASSVSISLSSTVVGSDSRNPSISADPAATAAEREAAAAQLTRWASDATIIDKEYDEKHARMRAAGQSDPDLLANDLLALHSKGGRGRSKKHGKAVALALRALGLVSDERLIEAADEGNIVAAVNLIRGGADVRATDKWQWTPLHMAAYGDFDKIARLLILHGADMTARTVDGETPLLLAERNGNHGVVRVIEEEFERKEREMEATVEAAMTQGKQAGKAQGGRRRTELSANTKGKTVDDEKVVADATVVKERKEDERGY